MNQRLVLAMGATLLCGATAGNAQNIPPSRTYGLQPTYVPRPNLEQGVPAPHVGVTTLAVPTPSTRQLAPEMPLIPSKPGPHAHPEAIDNPASIGDPKPYKYGYGLSKYDTAPTPQNPDTLSNYDLSPTPADR